MKMIVLVVPIDFPPVFSEWFFVSKISDKNLYAYNVYQIVGEGKKLFSEIKGNVDTIMGLPVKNIKKYLENII